MAIDFPASPTNGQTFVVGTVTYTWDGVKWTAIHKIAGATDTAKGIVQLADAAAITAGTAGLVVDAAQLKAENLWDRAGTSLAPHTAGDVVEVSAVRSLY